MSEPYWETLNTELINSVSLFEPAHVGIYAHSPGFCDSREQYDEITVSMIRDFKVKWRKNLHECPCCGQRSIIIRGAGEQCDVCGWYDDPFAEEFHKAIVFNSGVVFSCGNRHIFFIHSVF